MNSNGFRRICNIAKRQVPVSLLAGQWILDTYAYRECNGVVRVSSLTQTLFFALVGFWWSMLDAEQHYNKTYTRPLHPHDQRMRSTYVTLHGISTTLAYLSMSFLSNHGHPFLCIYGEVSPVVGWVTTSCSLVLICFISFYEHLRWPEAEQSYSDGGMELEPLNSQRLTTSH